MIRVLLIMVLLPLPCMAKDYIVKFQSTIQLQSLQAVGVQIKREIPQLNLRVVNQENLDRLLENSALRAAVEYFEEDIDVKADFLMLERQQQDRKDNDKLWNLLNTNVHFAWNISRGSRDVVIAISDTGVWRRHNDLGPNAWTNPGETGIENGVDISRDGVDNDGNGFIDDQYGWNFETNKKDPMDSHFHGTHIAGTLGAVANKKGIVGVNWYTSVMAVKFIGKDGKGKSSGAISSILYAVDNGAVVINCSWGSSQATQSLYEAIDYAKSHGVIIVAAAGNNDKDTDNPKYAHYPSGYDLENIISVGAHSSREKVVYFSNTGKKTVDLSAPGYKIFSTWNPMWHPSYRHFYYTISGTSMAAPHVTGTVALLYSINPNLKWQDVKEIILLSTRPNKAWKDKSVSGGLLDIGRAAEMARERLDGT